MRNTKSVTKGIKAGDRRIPYAQKGWEDARQGAAYDYDFVDAAPDRFLAQAYETNRLRVLDMQRKGMPVPAWKATACRPTQIKAAMTALEYRVKARGESYAVPFVADIARMAQIVA